MEVPPALNTDSRPGLPGDLGGEGGHWGDREGRDAAEATRQHGARGLEAASLRWGACGDIEERLEGEAVAPGLRSSCLSGRGTYQEVRR